MQHTNIEVLLGREMPHTRHERLPERSIIHPFRQGAVNIGVVDGGFAISVLREREALPLHPRVEHPQDESEDPMRAQFALWAPLGHREVRQEKCGELGFGELDGNRRRCRLWGYCAHSARTSCEAG